MLVLQPIYATGSLFSMDIQGVSQKQLVFQIGENHNNAVESCSCCSGKESFNRWKHAEDTMQKKSPDMPHDISGVKVLDGLF